MGKVSAADAALFCAFLATMLFSSYVFAVDPLSWEPVRSGPPHPPVRRMVLHEESACPLLSRSAGMTVPPYHWILSLQGVAVPTVRWEEFRRSVGGSIDVMIESVPAALGPQAAADVRRRQEAALKELANRFRAGDGGGFPTVVQHRQRDRGGCVALSPRALLRRNATAP